MRRKMVSITFAGMLSLMAASVIEGATPAAPEDATAGTATVAVQRVAVPGPAIRDEATMVLIGAALIGLAAAVRRAD